MGQGIRYISFCSRVCSLLYTTNTNIVDLWLCVSSCRWTVVYCSIKIFFFALVENIMIQLISPNSPKLFYNFQNQPHSYPNWLWRSTGRTRKLTWTHTFCINKNASVIPLTLTHLHTFTIQCPWFLCFYNPYNVTSHLDIFIDLSIKRLHPACEWCSCLWSLVERFHVFIQCTDYSQNKECLQRVLLSLAHPCRTMIVTIRLQF